MRTRLVALFLVIAVSSFIKLIIAGRSGYPGCVENQVVIADDGLADHGYQNWVINCQEGHHYGVGDCDKSNASSFYTPCTACPPFKVSFTVEGYSKFSSVRKNDNYSCFYKISNILYGIVLNTTEFSICITLLVIIILCSLLPTKKEEMPLSFALTVLIALPCLDFLSDLSYLLTICFRFLPFFVICFVILIFPWMQFSFKLVQVKAHPTLRLVEIPSYLFFDKYDNVLKTIFSGVVYFVFLTINGHIFWFILGGFLYATKLFTITR